MDGDIIIKNASQIVTCSGFAAKPGKAMADLGIIENGAVVARDGRIKAVGPVKTALTGVAEKAYQVIDARGKAVLPGFVDSHTHLIFHGERAREFAWRLRGDSYMEIMARGGGILGTVAATRKAGLTELMAGGKQRLDAMLAFGVTTVEGKSGYGLNTETEIRQLTAMAELDKTHPVDIVKTFLGAHAVPESYRGREDDFIDHLTASVLPEISRLHLAEFCDVFCEKGVFSVPQSRRLLQKAKAMGFKLKLHADEMAPLGGAELAAELGAVSADHLLQASDNGIRRMADAGVVATLLPATAFCLKEPYARGRFMIDAGCAVALATDLNPGSSYTESIPLLFALATLYMGLTTEEAVTALTLNGAAALDRADTIGSIDVGKKADMVILAHPSYHYLPYRTGINIVDKVIKNGVLVHDRQNSHAG